MTIEESQWGYDEGYIKKGDEDKKGKLKNQKSKTIIKKQISK